MASSSLTSTLLTSSAISFSRSLGPLSLPRSNLVPLAPSAASKGSSFSVRARALDSPPGSFFPGGIISDEDPPAPPGGVGPAMEDKEEPECPPGLRQYETMAVLRPDMSEDERLSLTQKYEELLVAGGGMYVEVFNRGVIPLAYSIKKKNKAGDTNTYLDGIYLLFTYFSKPESITPLEEALKTDDDVIRSMTFKIRKRRY